MTPPQKERKSEKKPSEMKKGIALVSIDTKNYKRILWAALCQ